MEDIEVEMNTATTSAAGNPVEKAESCKSGASDATAFLTTFTILKIFENDSL